MAFDRIKFIESYTTANGIPPSDFVIQRASIARGTQPSEPTKAVAPVITADQKVQIKLQELRDKRENKDSELKVLQNRVVLLEAENDVFSTLRDIPPQDIHISPKTATGVSESAAVLVLSDWHAEETVTREQTSGKNEYNLAVFHQRVNNLLHGFMAWFKIESAHTSITTLVVALLGDFITGSIHDDLAEGNQLPPAEAIHLVFSVIVSMFKFILANTPNTLGITVVPHSGNHGRMTKEQRIATEAGNSLEYFMYLMLRDYFQDEKRMTFELQAGYHSYVNFFEDAFVNRFHHGHQINFQGGVGGITIPVNKAIAQWNKARPANLDTFGHFHTRFDGGNFIANGALIGYNAYAVSIKASFEPPSQQFYLINREFMAKTMVAPIFVDRQGIEPRNLVEA